MTSSAPSPVASEVSLSTPRFLAGIVSRLMAFAAIATVIMGVARVWLWVSHVEPSRLPGWEALRPGMELGFLDDLAVAGALGLCWLVLVSPGLLLPARWRIRLWGLTTAVLAALLVGLVLLSIVEFYYYEFYHARFDALIFGLVENDTGTVLGSIWENYPVIRAVLGCLALGAVLGWALRRSVRGITRWMDRKSDRAQGVWASVTLIGLAAFTVLVLNPEHPVQRWITTPANDELGYGLAWNSPLSLARAVSLHQHAVEISTDPLSGLHDLGFGSLAQAAQAAGLSDTTPQGVTKGLFVTAPGSAPTRRPNVVLALLESFGADLLNTDNPKTNDLLGRLRPHLTKDDFFTHFYAGQNATHPEIENLLLGTPVTPLTLEPGRDLRFPSSAFLPFKRAGYRTIFIYGGRRTRQNLAEVLTRQGVDEVYDQDDIQKQFPEATRTSWGVYDAYLFRFVQGVLDREATPEHPVFIFMLTTTNHPPYVLDTPHTSLPLDPSAMGPRGNPNLDLRRSIMATYQYQADQFGAFLDHLDRSSHAQDTLVAAAGDHNLHEHYSYKLPEERPDTDRVFGFLRVPAAWRPATPIDHDRFAGHKDLVPTLVSLALPGSSYFNTGVNLFGPSSDDDYGLSQYYRVYRKDGLFRGLKDPQRRAWTEPNARVEGATEPPTPEQAQAIRSIAANVALRDWFIRSQVIAHRPEVEAMP